MAKLHVAATGARYHPQGAEVSAVGLLGRMRQSHHFRLIVAVLGCLTAHALQVWIFATAFYFMHHADGWGQLLGNFNGSMLDCTYFSFTRNMWSRFMSASRSPVSPLGACPSVARARKGGICTS